MDALEDEFDLLKDRVATLTSERDELKLALERSQTENELMRANNQHQSMSALGGDSLLQYVRKLEARLARTDKEHNDVVSSLQREKSALSDLLEQQNNGTEQPPRLEQQDVAAVVTVQDFEANALHDPSTPPPRRKIDIKPIRDDRNRSV